MFLLTTYFVFSNWHGLPWGRGGILLEKLENIVLIQLALLNYEYNFFSEIYERFLQISAKFVSRKSFCVQKFKSYNHLISCCRFSSLNYLSFKKHTSVLKDNLTYKKFSIRNISIFEILARKHNNNQQALLTSLHI